VETKRFHQNPCYLPLDSKQLNFDNGVTTMRHWKQIFSKKKVLITGLIAIFILMGGVSVVYFFSYDFISNLIYRWQLDELEAPGKGDVILLVAPHPDDEALSSCHLVRQALAKGAQVKLVMITNGDGFIEAAEMYYKKPKVSPELCREYAMMRQQETIAAVATMGIAEEDIVFLGFPDGGIESMLQDNWYSNEPYTNPYTLLAHTAYPNAYEQGVSYTGEGIVRVLATLLREVRPNVIIMPHPNDHHPDHRSVNAFMQLAAAQAETKDFQAMLYLVHHGSWPTPWVRDSQLHLVPPAAFESIDTKWRALDLSPADAISKGRTIELYESQTMVLGILMYAFERRNELFGELSSASLEFGDIDKAELGQPSEIVLHDPLEDNINQYQFPAADIVKVYAMAGDSGGMRLAAETNTREKVVQEWRLLCFYIEAGKLHRLEISINGEQVTALENGMEIDTTELEVGFADNRVDVSIPAEILGEHSSYYLTLASYHKGKLVDTTALRELIVSQGLALQ